MEFIEKTAKKLYVSNSGLSKPADQFGFGYPFLSYSDIFHNYYIPEKLTTLVNSTEKDRQTCSIKRGDVFLTRTSETTDELGMSCVALKDIPNATFNGFAKRLRPISDEIVPEYAAYYFRSNYFRAQCISMASLITRASLNDGMIGKLKVRYPKSTEDQKRIGDILMNYDKFIDINNKRIKILEQMAENLYKEWFVRFRFPGYETAEFENGIPKGWKTKTLNEWMIESFNGGWGEEIAMPKTPNEATVIRGTDIEDVKASRYCDVPLRYHKENDIKTKLLKENDIILELSNGNINNIGRTLYITKEILSHFDKVICASFCKTLRFSDVRVAFFVWQYIEYLQNSGMMFFYKNTGANGINNFNFKRFLRMQISIPTDGEKLEILLKIHNEISVIREKNFNLIIQRDLLLPRLMSGKLEV